MLETFADRLAAFSLLAVAFTATSVVAAPRGDTDAARSGAPVASTLIDGRFWSCTDSACTAHASGAADSQPATRECARAAEVLGPFTSYASGARVLTGDELARCNTRAKSTASLVAAR